MSIYRSARNKPSAGITACQLYLSACTRNEHDATHGIELDILIGKDIPDNSLVHEVLYSGRISCIGLIDSVSTINCSIAGYLLAVRYDYGTLEFIIIIRNVRDIENNNSRRILLNDKASVTTKIIQHCIIDADIDNFVDEVRLLNIDNQLAVIFTAMLNIDIRTFILRIIAFRIKNIVTVSSSVMDRL